MYLKKLKRVNIKTNAGEKLILIEFFNSFFFNNIFFYKKKIKKINSKIQKNIKNIIQKN